MGSIVPFARNVSFDPSAIEVMAKAYDQAVLSVDRGQHSQTVLEAIAKRIIACSALGERDPHILAQRGIEALHWD